MSLRAKIVAYLVLIHLILGGVAVFVLWEQRVWLLVAEAFFLVSIAVGVMLVRALFVPLELIRTGADLIAEREFGTHFREVGQPEMDALIAIYNRMIDRLREERVKLEEQQYFLAEILQASPSGIVILDLDSHVESANPRARELLASDLASGTAPPALIANMEVGETRVVAGPGSRRLRCTRASFLDRGFRRTFFLVDDLTRELRASERTAYHKLIRTMSHEVKNSVGAVTSLMESCRTYASQLGAEDRADYTGALEVSIERMRNLDAFMNAYADVVRIPAPDRRFVSLREVVDRIVLLMRPELERRRIACAWEVVETVPPVALDAAQFEQALVNVLKNAAEAIGEDGRITLRLERRGSRARLSIIDDGPGLAPEARASLFTPFFSTKKNGRGLGLTLVQEILAGHRFEFGLEPANPRGTCFWIEI